MLEKAQMGVVGTEETWRECVVATDAALGPAVGAMYVREAFHGESKALVCIEACTLFLKSSKFTSKYT